MTHLEYQHDESLLLNYKFLASNLTSIPIIQNFKIMHYQHTLKFASKSYFHNFRVNHTQDQSLSDNTHDFNDKIHTLLRKGGLAEGSCRRLIRLF